MLCSGLRLRFDLCATGTHSEHLQTKKRYKLNKLIMHSVLIKMLLPEHQ